MLIGHIVHAKAIAGTQGADIGTSNSSVGIGASLVHEQVSRVSCNALHSVQPIGAEAAEDTGPVAANLGPSNNARVWIAAAVADFVDVGELELDTKAFRVVSNVGVVDNRIDSSRRSRFASVGVAESTLVGNRHLKNPS